MRSRILPAAALVLAALACDGGPSGPGDGGPRLEIVSGDAQTDTVLKALQPLVVRAVDAGGNPHAGLPVHFTVLSGGGGLSVTSAGTDARGEARTAWTLGPRTNEQPRVEVRLLSAGGGALLAADTFTATPLPQVARKLVRVSGDAQSGAAGAALPAPLAVRVEDAYQNPVPGAAVDWDVRTGGGTFTPDPSAADAQGVARTTWTLGGTGGTQVARASIPLDTGVVFRATAAGGATIDFDSGFPLQVSADSLPVSVIIYTPLPTAGATASIAGRTVPLQLSGGRWVGTLRLEGLPAGEYAVVVTATDAEGNTFSHERTVRLNRRPRVVVTSPAEGQLVTTGTMQIAAHCVDDDGCTRMSVIAQPDYGSAILVATGAGAVDATVSLAQWNHRRVRLFIEAADAVHEVQRSLEVYVESGGGVTHVATVPGRVLDTDGARVLYETQPRPGFVQLHLRDVASGAEQVMEMAGPYSFGRLVPGGAVAWVQQSRIMALYGGAARDLGPIGPDPRVDGGYATWNTGATLRRYEASSGTVATVSTAAASGGHDVGPNGVVFFAGTDLVMYRWENGVTERVSPADGRGRNDARTDGVYAAYAALPAGSSGTETRAWSPSGGEVLVSETWGFYTTLVNGRLAFYRPGGSTGPDQVFVRTFGGPELQATRSATNAYALVLGPAGELVVQFNQPGTGLSLLLPPYTAEPRVIGSLEGRATFAGGELYVMVGNTAYRVDY